MTLHPNDQITCVRCWKHLGWLVDQDAPAGFDLICDACAEREHILPSAEDRQAWAKRWAELRGKPAPLPAVYEWICVCGRRLYSSQCVRPECGHGEE